MKNPVFAIATTGQASHHGYLRSRAARFGAAGIAVAALTAAIPAVASANWSEAQTVATNSAESDDLRDYAEAANGAAVVAWHGNQRTLAAYRGPNDSEFGAPFVVQTGGKPEFVRVAIGANGTAAVATWMPAVANSQVVARHSPGASSWSTPVTTPGGAGTNAHLAVDPSGEVTMVTWDVPDANPNNQSLAARTLPANSSTWSSATTLYQLAAPFTFQSGIGLEGNGEGDMVATVAIGTGNLDQQQTLAAVKLADADSWATEEQIGPNGATMTAIGVDTLGNALATYNANAVERSTYRSYLDDTWRGDTQVPSGVTQDIEFDLVGNAALVGSTPTQNEAVDTFGFSVRDYETGAFSASTTIGTANEVQMGVSPAGDVIVVEQSGNQLTSSWASTLSPDGFINQDSLPGSGSRLLMGVGADENSLGTTVWSGGTVPDGQAAAQTALADVFAATRPAGSGGNVALTTQQLLTNQRISQAAVLRSNAALAALDAGLPATAFRNSSMGAQPFSSSVPVTGTATPGAPSDALGFAIDVPSRQGGGGEVTLTKQQLLINQRISQAAVLRSNAVRDRINEGLTAAQIGGGAITSAKLQQGLSFGTLAATGPAGTPINVPSPSGGNADAVTVSEQQLLINQRISQAAVRRSNLNLAVLQSGLTGDSIANGAIAPSNVSTG